MLTTMSKVWCNNELVSYIITRGDIVHVMNVYLCNGETDIFHYF